MSSTNTTRALVVKHTYAKVVGWACVVLFTAVAVGAWTVGARGVSLVCLGFAALGIYAILISGSTQVDSVSIRSYTPLRSYQILWNEVQFVEVDNVGESIVFVGENKRLAIIGPKYWAGKDKRATGELISNQMDKYGIEFRITPKAMFRLSKNTRV